MPGCLELGMCTELQTGVSRKAMKLLQPPGWGALGKEGVLGQWHLVSASGTGVA